MTIYHDNHQLQYGHRFATTLYLYLYHDMQCITCTIRGGKLGLPSKIKNSIDIHYLLMQSPTLPLRLWMSLWTCFDIFINEFTLKVHKQHNYRKLLQYFKWLALKQWLFIMVNHGVNQVWFAIWQCIYTFLGVAICFNHLKIRWHDISNTE